MGQARQGTFDLDQSIYVGHMMSCNIIKVFATSETQSCTGSMRLTITFCPDRILFPHYLRALARSAACAPTNISPLL